MSNPDPESASAVELVALDHLRPDTRMVRIQGVFDEQACTELVALVDLQRASLTLDMLLLDLRELAEFGAAAVRTVVRLAAELGDADIALSLVTQGSLVDSALEDAGVRALFELHGSIDEALDVT